MITFDGHLIFLIRHLLISFCGTISRISYCANKSSQHEKSYHQADIPEVLLSISIALRHELQFCIEADGGVFEHLL